jgi:hypothetical protein
MNFLKNLDVADIHSIGELVQQKLPEYRPIMTMRILFALTEGGWLESIKSREVLIVIQAAILNYFGPDFDTPENVENTLRKIREMFDEFTPVRNPDR